MSINAAVWEPVKYSEDFFTSGVPQDLISIEECSDYVIEGNLLSGKKHKLKAGPGPKQKKPALNTNVDNVATLSVLPSRSGSTSDDNSICSNEISEVNVDAWKPYCLPEEILKALQEQSFERPTEIQEKTIPAAILGRRDVLGAAETGSGKTLAFGIPILAGILNLKKDSKIAADCTGLHDFVEGEVARKYISKPLYALILTPTRELAIQIKHHLSNVAKYTGIQIAVVVGGMAVEKQERILAKGPEIVVATPGRLWELIQQGNQHLSQVGNIRFLAIDETDRMFEKDHFQELHSLLEKINDDREKQKYRQNFVFSATLTLVHDLPKHLLRKRNKAKKMSAEQKLQRIVDILGITQPKVVNLSDGISTPASLTECRISCSITDKDYYVYYFIRKHLGRTLIFCNSIGCVKRLANLLNILECKCLPLHANMQQRQRLKNLDKFKSTENSILIATDVAARGLDIPKVDHVLHYQTPRTSESYIHRSGRTARASRQGITVVIMEPNEFHNYIRLCKTLGKSDDLPAFPVEDKYLSAIKNIVDLARELDNLSLQVKKANSEEGWLQKAAKDMEIIIDNKFNKYDNKETAAKKKIANLKRKQLSALLSKPVFPKGFVGRFVTEFTNLSPVEAKNENSAIEVMKNSIEEKIKKSRVRLYKPKLAKQARIKDNTTIKLRSQKLNAVKRRKFKK